MKKWGAVLGVAWWTDAVLRLQAHLAAPLAPGTTLFPGLELASVPGAGLRLTGLGAATSAAVLLSMALLATGAFVLTQVLFELPRGKLFLAGLMAAMATVAWTGLDLAECLVLGGRRDTLAWLPEGPAPVYFGLGDLVLPLLLLGLAACWAGQLGRGLMRQA